MGLAADSENTEEHKSTHGQGYEVPDSVFDANVPGVMTKEQVQEQIDIADVKFSIAGEVYSLAVSYGLILSLIVADKFVSQHLGSWRLDDGENLPLIAIAEFVACLGPELAKEIVTTFG